MFTAAFSSRFSAQGPARCFGSSTWNPSRRPLRRSERVSGACRRDCASGSKVISIWWSNCDGSFGTGSGQVDDAGALSSAPRSRRAWGCLESRQNGSAPGYGWRLGMKSATRPAGRVALGPAPRKRGETCCSTPHRPGRAEPFPALAGKHRRGAHPRTRTPVHPHIGGGTWVTARALGCDPGLSLMGTLVRPERFSTLRGSCQPSLCAFDPSASSSALASSASRASVAQLSMSIATPPDPSARTAPQRQAGARRSAVLWGCFPAAVPTSVSPRSLGVCVLPPP